ncbi:hypothetical protein QE436_004397 [Pantoea anthophila]|nr:hypothetical protein [Pantoea anthophila]MDQ1214984.1 hypothetical protein [Pantoea anthophila]
MLENQPVEEMWDVVRRTGKRLNLVGNENALPLARAPCPHPKKLQRGARSYLA